MTYSTAHYYLTYGGSQYGTREIWQTGLRFAPSLENYNDPAELQNQLEDAISVDDCLTAAGDMIANPAGVMWSNAIKVSWAKVAVITEAGKYYADPKVAQSSGRPGSAGSFGHPAQLAVAVSHWSGENLGHANHGRAYLPAPHTMIQSVSVLDGLATVEQADGLKDLYATFVNRVAGEISTIIIATDPVIMSTIGTGQHKEITSIGVGRVIDTIRKRRNGLDEMTTYRDLNP